MRPNKLKTVEVKCTKCGEIIEGRIQKYISAKCVNCKTEEKNERARKYRENKV
jgi:phage FluMu protein Com